MKYLYKYPQAAYPYSDLVDTNRRRGKHEPEYKLLDTGVFNQNRYFDVFVEYAKETPEDVLIKITAWNRGPEPATLHLLPTLWFRNTWSWKMISRNPSYAWLRVPLARRPFVLLMPYSGRTCCTAKGRRRFSSRKTKQTTNGYFAAPTQGRM